ncbi:MAG: hypothetical protein M4D80_15545 [Myxococcota bacterium]|nr:hypothetical protein [Deltaproteobacteria bacterium]MDQ3336581.1 hypothetical protein [Myxococcota bacterium]
MKIKETTFDGRAAFELVERRVRLVIVHSIGPRIAFFGRVGGENLLYWDETRKQRRGDWHLYGGHRFWIARTGADESEETYAPDNEPCRVKRTAGGIAVSTPVDASRVEKTLVIRARNGVWTIDHVLRNTSDMLWAGGAWALTATRPLRTTRYEIPLDGGDPGWDVISIVIPRRWGGNHKTRIADPQFTLTDDALTFRSRGLEGKRLAYAPRGTLVMADKRGVFTKSAPVVVGAQYPYGANVAAYLAPKSLMVELETMAPSQILGPGHILHHVETWTLG